MQNNILKERIKITEWHKLFRRLNRYRVKTQVGFAESKKTADNRANIGGTIIGATIIGQ